MSNNSVSYTIPKELEDALQQYGSSINSPDEPCNLTTSGDSANISISSPNHSGTSIEIDSVPALGSGDSIIIRDSEPMIIGDPVINPFGASPQPNPWAPLQQPLQQPFGQPQYPVVPYPEGYTPTPRELKEDEVVVFLEMLGVIPEKVMKKIKDALKPIEPIVHNNRIDDLIFDIEE
jgi:hypothetical protein